jgi:hypothetical protein
MMAAGVYELSDSLRPWGRLVDDEEPAADQPGPKKPETSRDTVDQQQTVTVEINPLTAMDLRLLSMLPAAGSAKRVCVEELQRALDKFAPTTKKICQRWALDHTKSTTKELCLEVSEIDPWPHQHLDVGWLLTEPQSLLTELEQAEVVSYDIFSRLSDAVKDQLLNYLPDIDRVSPASIKQLLDFDPIFAQEYTRFITQLSAGQRRPASASPSSSSSSHQDQPDPAQWKIQQGMEVAWGSSSGKAPSDPNACSICGHPLPCDPTHKIFEFRRQQAPPQ